MGISQLGPIPFTAPPQEQAIEQRRGVRQSTPPLRQATSIPKGGDAQLLETLGNLLPQLNHLPPAQYHRQVVMAREALSAASRTNTNPQLAATMNRAAQFLDGERRLLEAMDIYRHLLHQG